MCIETHLGQNSPISASSNVTGCLAKKWEPLHSVLKPGLDHYLWKMFYDRYTKLGGRLRKKMAIEILDSPVILWYSNFQETAASNEL